MKRTLTGLVSGGMPTYQLPPAIQPGELATHAIGRLDTMSEILVQAAYLRSAGHVSQATGFGGALFQDVKGDYSGTNRIAAAHRALFALQLDGRNAANIPYVYTRARLQELVIAPQARTDLVIRPVNYADQQLENAISSRVFDLMRATLMRQHKGRIEKSLLIDASFGIQRLLHVGFDEAIVNTRRSLQERGWEEYRVGSGRRGPLAGASDSEIDGFLDKAFGGDPTIHVAGPTRYGDLTEIILGTSQQITDMASPSIAQGDIFDAMVDSVAEAAGSSG
jgi:hypothetical protein